MAGVEFVGGFHVMKGDEAFGPSEIGLAGARGIVAAEDGGVEARQPALFMNSDEFTNKALWRNELRQRRDSTQCELCRKRGDAPFVPAGRAHHGRSAADCSRLANNPG